MRTPDFWQTASWQSTLLRPLAALYACAVTRPRPNPTPNPILTLCVGNLVAGGAGKTPTVHTLLPLLQSLGFQPAIILRGHGGTERGPLRVTPHHTAQQVGDEALLHRALAPTYIARDRRAAIALAASEGATLALLDDGFQHRGLTPDLSLLVIDGPYGFGNGQLIPAGPLREPIPQALARTHAILIIGPNAQKLRFPHPTFTAHITPHPPAHLADQPLLAFAGMGRPEKFFQSLRAQGMTLAETISFPDHHPYRMSELIPILKRAKAQGLTPVTTSKDAARLPESLQADVTSIPATLGFDDPQTLLTFLKSSLCPA